MRLKLTGSDYAEFYDDVYKRPNTAFDHYSQSSIKNKSYNIHHKYHYDNSDNEPSEDEDGIKTFRRFVKLI